MRTILAVMMLASGFQGQTTPARPDFNGHWVVFATTDTSPSVVREFDIAFNRDKGTLTVTRRMRGLPRTETYTMGTVNGPTVMGDRGPVTKTRRYLGWDGPGLVVGEYSSLHRDADSGHEEYWTIDAQGRLKVETTVWSPGNAATTNSVIYIKQKISHSAGR